MAAAPVFDQAVVPALEQPVPFEQPTPPVVTALPAGSYSPPMEPIAPPSGELPLRLLFKPEQRLTAGKQFETAHKRGRRKGDSLFQVVVLSNGLPQGRLGMAVSIKACGKAVRRNLVRRVIRDTFRQCQQVLTGLDVVVNARPAAKTASNADMVSSLEHLFRQLMHTPR